MLILVPKIFIFRKESRLKKRSYWTLGIIPVQAESNTFCNVPWHSVRLELMCVDDVFSDDLVRN